MTDLLDTVAHAEAEILQPVRHAFFLRRGGVSQGLYESLNAGTGSADDPAAVAENRQRIARHFGRPASALVTMHQTHSADVLTVDAPPRERPKVDGLVTDRPGLVLGVLTADCAPVLFADRNAGVIGAAHAGWRGAWSGVLEATVEAMLARGARRADIAAAVGPTIAQESYEVGPEFVARFTTAPGEPANARFFAPAERPGHALFDLPGYVLHRLAAAGVTACNLGADTYGDERRFYSYRRATHRGEADYGRLLSAIVLEG